MEDSFRVTYLYMDDACSKACQCSNAWLENLANYREAVCNLIQTTNMEGEAADSLREYLSHVHGNIITCLEQLITIHMRNFFLYFNQYTTEIDSSLQTMFNQDDLIINRNTLEGHMETFQTTNEEIKEVLSTIQDTVYISAPGTALIEDACDDVIKKINDLIQAVLELEDKHYENDFEESGNLYDSLLQYVRECSKLSRTFKTDYSVDAIKHAVSYGALNESFNAGRNYLIQTNEEYQHAYNHEIGRLNQWQDYFERQKEAEKQKNWAKWVFNVGTALVITFSTGGTATPIVVAQWCAGAGFFEGMVMEYWDQYAEYGGVHDFSKIGESGFVSAGDGFVEGFITAEIGDLFRIYAGIDNMTYTGTIDDIMDNVIFDTGSSVIAGMMFRFTEELAVANNQYGITKEEALQQALDGALDLESIELDAVSGLVQTGTGRPLQLRSAN